MTENEANVIELETEYAVFEIPEETIRIEIEAQIYMDGKLQRVESTMEMQAVKDAFYATKNGYFPENCDYNDPPPANCAVFDVPKSAVDITFHAEEVSDGELHKRDYHYGIVELREAFRKGENYIPDDATFVLTEKGKRIAEEILNKEGSASDYV